MANVNRSTLTRYVYQRLAEPDFRQRLTATSPDGSHPIIVALRGDPMAGLLQKLHKAGGAGNVVVPVLNGFVVLAIQSQPQTYSYSKQPCDQGKRAPSFGTEDRSMGD